jgi:hypothetical protein
MHNLPCGDLPVIRFPNQTRVPAVLKGLKPGFARPGPEGALRGHQFPDDEFAAAEADGNFPGGRDFGA